MKKKWIDLGNKERIYYLEEGIDNSETLILIHGNMSSSVHYKNLINILKDQYHIYALDLRGFGDSTYHTPIDSLEDFSDDVINFTELMGISKYYLAGWSTGGAIALKIAAKRNNDVQKLILIESCSYRGYPIFKKDALGQPLIGEYYSNKEEMAKDPVQVLPMELCFKNNDIATMKYIWDAVIYTVNKPSPEDDSLFLNETMKQRNIVDVDWGLTTFNMSNFSNGVTLGDNSIKDVKCPVISFWGDKDITVLEYMIDETVEALINVEKVILEDCGHSPLVDCPELLSNKIIKFLQ